MMAFFMKNYSLDYNTLHNYSHEQTFAKVPTELKALSELLDRTREELGFPAVNKDVAQLMRILNKICNIKTIFEFGSGYGHSAFWYFLDNPNLEKVYLTEKNLNLKNHFDQMPWPADWKEKMDYFQGDAFERLEQVESFDFVLIDGLKGKYLDFLKAIEGKISKNGIAVIDNAYWRGSFLDPVVSAKNNSAKSIKELHNYIEQSSFWTASFIPFTDGVILLVPNEDFGNVSETN